MIHSIKRDHLSPRIDPEQDAVIPHTKLVQTLEVRREVFHGRADLLRVRREPRKSFEDAMPYGWVESLEIALEGGGRVEAILAHDYAARNVCKERVLPSRCARRAARIFLRNAGSRARR